MPAAREFPPLLMSATAAAHYLSVSESTLRKLGLPRKMAGGKRLYDRRDLDQWADSLPYENAEAINGGW